MIPLVVRWLRVVLPPGWVVTTCFLVFLLSEGIALGLAWWLGFPPDAAWRYDMRNAVATLGCLCYGVFRVSGFHPIFHDDYRAWLKQSPWSLEKPLPAGPCHLVLQDAAVLAVLLLLLHDWPVRIVVLPQAFLVAYLGCMCCACWLTGERLMGYTLAFGLGVWARVSGDPLAAMTVLGILYLPGYFGLRRSLARFPWEMPQWWGRLQAAFGKPQERFERSGLGWPFDHLRAKPTHDGISYTDGVLISLLVGWWAYAGLAILPDPRDAMALGFVTSVYLTFGAVTGRMVIYCQHYRPPISLWGRIWTFRWIIPRYDQVLVAPALAALVGFGAPWLFARLGLPPEIALPIAISLVLLIILNMGPRLQHWALTGRHRLVPGMLTRNKREFVRL